MNEILSKFINLGLTSSYPSLPDGESFLQKIIPNLWAFLVQFLALIVLIVIFFVFAYKPVRNIIRKRQEHIESQINEAEDANLKSKQSLDEAKITLNESKKEALKIIDAAKEDALKHKDLVIKETKEEINSLKLKAQKDIERDKIRAQEEINNTIVDVALSASKEVLKREINEKDNDKLIKEFIEKMNKE